MLPAPRHPTTADHCTLEKKSLSFFVWDFVVLWIAVMLDVVELKGLKFEFHVSWGEQVGVVKGLHFRGTS